MQKFSHKGWVCKTWEGELALVSLPGSPVEKFFFTVHNDAVAKEVGAATGKRVTLHYEEKVGLPTSCFGETRHFVTKVTATQDIPIGPGVKRADTGAPSAALAPPSQAQRAGSAASKSALRVQPALLARHQDALARTANVAVRNVVLCRSAVSQIFFSASTMILSRRTLISSSLQKKLEKSCTHSK